MKNNRIFLYVVAGFLLVSFMFFWYSNQNNLKSGTGGQMAKTEGFYIASTTISIGHLDIKALVADTPELQVKGLGGRDSLPDDETMLFVFEDVGLHGIWMKDMKFSIDILWIDRNGRIISIEEGISPQTYPTIYMPVSPSKYVLEANDGFVKKNNLKIGDMVFFKK